MNIIETLKDFVKQSERVLTITHKPRDFEFRQMALTTGVGMAIVGLVGFAIAMVAYFLKG
ncbi:MAG: protein translocase SEC61 complex subunit gamma [Candidatus Micrarchaeia archaeon]